MPVRAPRPCSNPGCRALVAKGRCPEHPYPARVWTESERRYDADRGSRHERGYGSNHEKWRLLVLAREPLCRVCLAAGVMEPSTVADHILPKKDGGDNGLGNGQGLCASCHNRKTSGETAART